MFRVFVGGLHHESDTFNPITTGWADITLLSGDGLIQSRAKNSITGIIDCLKKAGCEILPSLMARAVPNGVWDRAVYETLRDRMLDALKAALPLDGICLSLHGSMRVEGIGKGEDDLIAHIRSICPTVPIYASLDMHCSYSSGMDGCYYVGYKCAPHTDEYETGVHAASMLLEHLGKDVEHYQAVCKVPMLIAGEKSETSTEPMKTLVSRLRELEKEPAVAAASYLLGFPWADCAEAGVTALVVSRQSQAHAGLLSTELAKAFWQRRFDFAFCTEAHDEESAISKTRESLGEGVYPIVLSDSGDNPTAGSSQDVTIFLEKILADPVLANLDPPLVYQAFYDPETVQKAIDAGLGKTIRIALGASFDTKTSTPVEAEATVVAIHRSWQGVEGSDLALLLLGGVHVIATSKHVGCYEPEMMRALGLVPEESKVIVVKLGYLEPELKMIAKRSILALTRGSSDEVLERLPYRKIPRPIFPLDRDCEVLFPAE